MSQLNTNTATLQELLDIANALPEAGVVLPELTNPGTASNLLSSKQLIDTEGNIVEGTMINNGAVTKTLNTSTTSYTIPAGYHNGSGKVSITTETKTVTPKSSSQSVTPTSGKVLSKVTINGDANLIAENIKSGVSIFGVNGSLNSGAQIATGTITPSTQTPSSDTVISTITGLAFTPIHVIISIPNSSSLGYNSYYINMGYTKACPMIQNGVANTMLVAEFADFDVGGADSNGYLQILENGFEWKMPAASFLGSTYEYIAIG